MATFERSPEAPDTAVTDEMARQLLGLYFQETGAMESMPKPKFIIHNLTEDVRIDPKVNLPSAYHMAQYVHRFVTPNTQAITAMGRFAKVIGNRMFTGVLLYHVDRIGNHMTRGLDAKLGYYWVLDDSPFWASFPYDFEKGPKHPEGPLGYHPGKA
jgi:hypothetical protein